MAAKPFARAAPLVGLPWLFVKPALVTLLVTSLVAVLPVIHAGVNGTSLLKGLVALPTGLSYASTGRLRTYLSFASICAMFALLAGFAAANYYEPDTACDTAVLSVFALAALITAPNRRDWSLVRARRGLLSVPAKLARTARRSFADPARRLAAGSTVVLVGRVAAAGMVAVLGIALALLAGRIDPFWALRMAELVLDAALGALAMWFIGRSIAGPAAGTAAGLLWACSAVRLEYNSVLPGLVPTALVPVVAALALGASRTGTLSGPWLALALAGALVALSWSWPLLAVTTALIVVFLFWSLGEVGQGRWALLALVAAAVVPWLAWGAHSEQLVAAQTAFTDPAEAAVALASGGDGGLPWEFFYPSAFGFAYAKLLSAWLTASGHWGNDQLFAIAPGWAQLVLAAVGGAVMYRRGRTRLLRVWLVAVAVAICLALPTRYLGVPLPSLTRLIQALAPGFAFGAQFALLGAFFVALLAGVGAEVIARRNVVRVLALATFVLLDVLSLPSATNSSSVLARLSPAIPPSTKVAFYPFLTSDYGPEYDDLLRIAHRFGYRLANEDRGAGALLGDLALPGTLQRLRSLGVAYAVVSPGDYSRRREILSEAHVILPLDQLISSPGWLAPEPADLSGMPIVRSQSDGSFLIRISPAER
jgi:hypothetical protein